MYNVVLSLKKIQNYSAELLEVHRYMSLAVRVSASTGIRVMATTPRREGKKERIKVSCFSNGRQTPQGTFATSSGPRANLRFDQ